MRIRKKAPKPSARRPPLFFIGYGGPAPAPDELRTWYDVQYGGPLTIRPAQNEPDAWQAGHGPWTAHLVIPFPGDQVAPILQQLAWEHKQMGAIAPSAVTPKDAADTVLFAARLARGLTLLTQGTAYDLATEAYLNPSDWQDRSLSIFRTADHVAVTHGDDPEREWSYTLGLGKFALDDLETFQAKGLPATGAAERLLAAADEILRTGQNPKVGSTVQLPSLGLTARITRHRTISPGGKLVILREVAF